MIPMKTLTMPNGKTYEIVDEQARAAISNEREDIRRSCSTAIVQTVDGSPIAVTDSSDNRLLGLRLFGKTTQRTTTGAQLFDKDTAVSGLLETDGTVTTDGAYFTSDFIPVTPNTMYYHTQKDSVRGKFYDSNKNPLTDAWDTQITTGGYFTTSANAYYFRTTVSVHCVDSFMLNIGSTGLPYEPYTGRVAAPNPDYPQELKSPGSNGEGITVYAESLNLIDAKAFEVYSNASIDVSEDGYEITVTGGSNNAYTSSVCNLSHMVESLRGRKVYFKHDSIVSTAVGVNCGPQINMKRPTHTDYLPLNDTTMRREIKIPDDIVDISIGIYTNNTGTSLANDNTVIVRGLQLSLVDGDWKEAGSTSMRITMPNGLPGIPVNVDGNYTDSNGQQWICDEIDFERGVYIHRVGITSFSGATWYQNSNGKYYASVGRGTYSNEYIPICSHMTGGTSASGNLSDIIFINANNDIRLNITLDDNTPEGVANIMNDGAMCGVLLYPNEESLTAEQLAAYKQLYTNYPGSTFLNKDAANMEVKYNADTQIYLDNCMRPSDEQVIAAVNAWLNSNYTNAEGVSF